jgi:hypothetical protein
MTFTFFKTIETWRRKSRICIYCTMSSGSRGVIQTQERPCFQQGDVQHLLNSAPVAHHSSFHCIMSQAPALSAELEEYAQLYFKYTVLIQEQADAIRHMRPDEVSEAHARVTEEHNELQRDAPRQMSLEGLYHVLEYFGGLCENAAPQTIIELS